MSGMPFGIEEFYEKTHDLLISTNTTAPSASFWPVRVEELSSFPPGEWVLRVSRMGLIYLQVKVIIGSGASICPVSSETWSEGACRVF
uniref:Uncharacterized protein n=1 Tax=Manihot esculenta TaxID=3983 RepID=A0A2C9VTS5_MANES